MARRLLLAAVALPVAFATAAAQANNPAAPASSRADYALTNVRIVVSPGKVIERGTVLTRDGHREIHYSELECAGKAIPQIAPRHSESPNDDIAVKCSPPPTPPSMPTKNDYHRVGECDRTAACRRALRSWARGPWP